ncbi:hypothetical protein [Cereibacter sphaeroides]|uniref:hypothetical protein n=1 Tax=Cereibacter sphaeroides TaxID=1063 RepID=UPI0003184B51|nr:hypothetical protein [Cereibacter sphaeroides]
MRTALASLALASMVALPASGLAGPWARETGRVFLTLSQQQDGAGESWTGLWAEYGLTPRITLGLDAGRSGRGDGKLILWAQKAWERGPHRIAASAGLGAVRLEGALAPLAQLGGAWGRGIETRFGPGWLALEMRGIVTGRNVTLEQRLDAQTVATVAFLVPETSAKAELTLGLSPRDRLKVIEQLQLEYGRDSGFDARLATSLVYDLARPTKLEMGLILPIESASEPALKLGLWLEF